MSSGVLPKAAVREAGQFYELPLESGYRAFQNGVGIQSAPIDGLEGTLGAPFGDVLSQIIASYCLGIDPSGLRPGLQFVGCTYGVAPGFAFGSLDWRAAFPDAGGFWTSDHFTFLRPATVVPSAAISRQVSISAEVLAHLGALLREHGGGGGVVIGEASVTEAGTSDSGDDFEIAAAPGVIAPRPALN